MNPNKLLDEEAEELLKLLSAYYQQPVMPIKKYCKAIEEWANCISQGIKDGSTHGIDYYEQLGHIILDIHKSNLLGRVLYGGEELRTRKCPSHNGRWMGHVMLSGCWYYCGGTGFLPENMDEKTFQELDSVVKLLNSYGIKEDFNFPTKPDEGFVGHDLFYAMTVVYRYQNFGIMDPHINPAAFDYYEKKIGLKPNEKFLPENWKEYLERKKKK